MEKAGCEQLNIMETKMRHNCQVCGGFDFIKENGYFYCIECQTQCEGIREQVFEEQGGNNDDEILLGTPFVFKKVKKKEKTKRKGEDFTTWEMYNCILRGLVEELISFGAPKSIKDTVLQLWAFYLQKLEIAFFSKDEKALPKLGHKYNSVDAKHVYGLKKRKPMKRSRILDASCHADLNTSIHSLEDWDSQKLKKSFKKRAKKAFMEKVAELSISEFAETESMHCSLDQTNTLDVSLFDDSLSVSSVSQLAEEKPDFPKLERSKAAMRALERSKALFGTVKDETAFSKHGSSSPHLLTKYKLVVLLYLALLYEGSTIQISDMLRWIREGHLSYHEAVKHLPETCFANGRQISMFRSGQRFPEYSYFVEHATLMTRFLGMTDWPLPKISEIAKKYVMELHLPEMFSELVERFVDLVPLAYNLWSETLTEGGKRLQNYEAAVLAIIIIILKLLFGLDGRTEHRISKVASQLNILLKMKKSKLENAKLLFVWKDWVQQLICRNAVLSRYHFPTKHVLCPEAYGNPFAYINYCKNWHDVNAGFEEKYDLIDDKLLRVVHPALLNTLSSILEKLRDPASGKNEDIQFPQCFTPYSLYIKMIIEKSTQVHPPLIGKPALDVLTQDFSTCDLTYLLQPELLVNLASARGQQLKIRKKSAQKKFKRVSVKLSSERSIHRVKFKGTLYISVTDCNREKYLKTKQSEEFRKGSKKQIVDESLKMSKRRMNELLKKNKSEKKKKRAKELKSGKVKKQFKKSKSLKSKDRGTLKSSNAKDVHEKSRKRKKKGLLSENSKRIKLSKLLKLYVPSSEYWSRSVENDLMEGDFERHVLPKFPFSFSWLLSECALVSEMSKLSVYREVLRIETHCYNMFK